MKKGILQTAVIFAFALLLGFGITLMTPLEARADICGPGLCTKCDMSCVECSDGPCTRYYINYFPNIHKCCGAPVNYTCGC